MDEVCLKSTFVSTLLLAICQTMAPLPFKVAPPLNGIKEGTFVYHTIKDRWPRILTKVIDQVHRYFFTHVAVYKEEGDADIKAVIRELSEMKYEMQTDKPLRDLDDEGENHILWNDHLRHLRKERGERDVSWYREAWLFVECYLYRRIAGAFAKTNTLKQFDPFITQKQNAFVDSIPAMETLAKEFPNMLKETRSKKEEAHLTSRMLQICIWGNQCDLSLSGGKSIGPGDSPIEQVDKLASNIILNQIDEAVELLLDSNGKRIDIALDNAGLELFDDLLFGEFLLQKKRVSKVVFHGKTLPWFVSDVTNNDFFWLTEMLLHSHCDEVRDLGARWKERLSQGSFEFRAHPFWTMPFDYSEMAKYCPDLYDGLTASSLILFKGDLHYRKLVGDRDWPLDTPFKLALRGFNPAPILALRTLKAETQVGLAKDVIDRFEKKYEGKKSWMVTGEFAVAQFYK